MMIKDAMEKNEKATPNGADLEVLKKHFRMCFNSDGSLDLEKLKARLGDQVAISNEGYELKFLGKNYARLLTSLETTTVVVPDKEHNAKPENAKSRNVYISGDNLDALKHLLKSKQGQVKCIYIDPPYNTGSDGFVYNDSFGFKVEELANKLSISEDEAQRILDFTKRGSASHSAWLMFMYPRLMLARDLLAKDGVIFISIDDNEQANLRLLCDEIFGEQNFVAQFIWIAKSGGGADNGCIVQDQEYVLCYAARLEAEATTLNRISVKAEPLDRKDEHGPYRIGRELNKWGANSRREDRPTMYFPIKGPKGEDVYPIRNDGTEGCWRWGKAAMLKAVSDGNCYFQPRKDGTYVVYEKIRSTDDRSKPYRSFLQDVGYTADGSEEVTDLFSARVFNFAKPLELMKHIFEIATRDNSIVLDFFSGAASTAHAVLQYNAEHNAHLQYVMVQLQEPCPEGSEAIKVGYKTIDEIGQARIKKAAAKISAENPLLAKTMDLGFKHYTLKEVEGKTLDKIEKFDLNDNALAATDDILKEFGVETVLATWLVHDGYGFGVEPKVIDLDGYKAYWMEKHVYLIEPGLSDKGISALFDKFETEGSFNPGNVVVFGYSFSWTQLEALKNNLLKIAANGTNKHVLLDKRY